MADVIQIRRDTASLWTNANPTLAAGEFGYETDTTKIKIGDGSTAWTSLGYYTLGTLGFAPLANPTFTGTVTGPTINASTALQVGGTAITSTAAELNILDGVTSTTAELNILDGVTATAAELNHTDGVTSNIQTQLNGIVPGMHSVAFTASGAIAAKKPVILNGSAGTVSEVAIADRTRTTPSPSYVSDFDWDISNDQRHHHAAAWETNGNRFVVAMESGIRVGTVTGTGSNTTVVMGNETVMAREDGQGYYTQDIIADPNNSGKFLIAYDYSYEHYYRVLTIIGEGAGAKVDLGTKSNLPSSPKISSPHTTYTSSHSMAWDKASGKAVSVYCAEYTSTERMVCTVINVNGTVATNEDSVIVCENPDIEYRRVPCIAVDPNTPGLFVVAWRQSGSGTWAHKGVMRALKLSGTTLTAPGTTTPIPNSDLRSGAAEESHSGPSIVFDPTTARQIVVLESGATNTRSWIANVPNASGAFTGSITFQSNTPVSITSSERTSVPAITPMGQTASGEAGKYLILYHDLGSSSSPTGTWYHQVGSLSGTTMTWATREDTGHGCDISYGSGNPQYSPNAKICSDPKYAGRAVSLVNDNEGSNTSHHVMVVEVGGVYNTTNLAGNFMGIADADIANTASGNIVIKGGVTALPASQTFTVTVANSGGNKFVIDGVLQDTLDLYEGYTYKFDQSDSTNSGHPLRLSTTSNGTHNSGSEYTTGVTTNGTPGSSGAYTQIVVAGSAATLYYYCSSHSGMGGTANTPATLAIDSTYYVQNNGAVNTATTGTEIGKAITSTKVLLKGI